MTDVLEHLDDPSGALVALRQRLNSGGWLLVTVPALNWLWSAHDFSHHHRRRYRAEELASLIREAGFETVYLSYYNFFLFPFVAVARLVRRRAASPDGTHDLDVPIEPFNRLLYLVFSSERFILGKLSFPIGISLIALGRRPAEVGRF